MNALSVVIIALVGWIALDVLLVALLMWPRRARRFGRVAVTLPDLARVAMPYRKARQPEDRSGSRSS